MKKINRNILSKPLTHLLVLPMIAALLICTPMTKAVILELEILGFDDRSYDTAGLEIFVSITQTEEGVRFDFYNESTSEFTIDKLFFEDGILANVSGMDFGDGTFFELDENTAQLPGGNTLTPNFETAYSFDSGPPAEYNGIDPGQWSAVIFNVDSETDFDDLLSLIYDGSFRIGVHVSGISSRLSASAVNIIPEPATLILLGIGSWLFLRRKGL